MINIGKAISIVVLLICCTSAKDSPLGDVVQKNPPVEGIRIAWDHSTLKLLSRPNVNYAGYARMIKLFDGSLICVYESEGNIECIRSNGDIQNWSQPVIVAARENQIARCVPDILEKADHSLLVSYNLRPAGNNNDTSKRFSIRVKHSTDGGRSWTHETEIYKAGHEFKNGCWEPAQIQLPSGEIQLFIANEGPYTQSDEQEITIFRSFDGGFKWSEGETACFRKGFRDGMPVPLVLKNTNEIIFSIEDNGIATPQFKPAVIRSSIDPNWNQAVSGSDKNRSYALDKYNVIPPEKYAGAPYIRRLNSGEVILSYQGDEKRSKNQWDQSDMIVCIGDSMGRNFNRKSLPFYTTDPSKTCLWNSITVESDSTVIALASTNVYGSKTGVWMIRGHILRDIKSPKQTLTIDGEAIDPLYNSSPQVFIGGYGTSNALIRSCYDKQMFYTAIVVKDQSIHASTGDPAKDDGVEILLDPANASTSLPGKGIYAINITAGGKIFTSEGENGKWKSWKAEGIIHSVKPFTGGYRVEFGIPWKSIGGIPSTGRRMGFNAVLNEISENGTFNYAETINGNETDKPFTWSSVYIH